MLSELLATIGKARAVRRERKLSRPEFEVVKLEKFRRLVRHVNERSPYYRRIIAERKIDVDRCSPSDFPLLTKSLLMQSFDEIATAPGVTKQAIADFLTRSHDPRELFLGKYRVIHTSGSSGEVGYFVYSPLDWIRGTYWERGGQPQRKRKGKFRLAYYAAIDGHYAGVTMIRSIEGGIAKWFVDVGCFEVNSPLPEVIAGLNEFQPDFLTGYTTAIKILAEKQRAGELKLEYLIGIATAGEATTEADRAFLEQTFGCPLVNTYGCSEHLGMGGSRPGSPNIVLHDHDLIFELYPDHSVVTNLFNYTLPLIRYRMADILRPVESGAHAPYLVIESLVVRNRRRTPDAAQGHRRRARRHRDDVAQARARTDRLRVVLSHGRAPDESGARPALGRGRRRQARLGGRVRGLLRHDGLSRLHLVARARERVPEGKGDPHAARPREVVRVDPGDDLLRGDVRARQGLAGRAALREDDVETIRRPDPRPRVHDRALRATQCGRQGRDPEEPPARLRGLGRLGAALRVPRRRRAQRAVPQGELARGAPGAHGRADRRKRRARARSRDAEEALSRAEGSVYFDGVSFFAPGDPT